MQKLALPALYKSGLVKAPTVLLLALKVCRAPNMLSTELADVIGVNTTTVSMAINALAKDGMVERRYPYRDRRQVSLHLTPKGDYAATGMLNALSAFQKVDSADTTIVNS